MQTAVTLTMTTMIFEESEFTVRALKRFLLIIN